MSNLVDYAKDELKRIGMIDSGEAYNDFATKAILDLIELFASQYHSGFTASYVANMFHRLASAHGIFQARVLEWGAIAF